MPIDKIKILEVACECFLRNFYVNNDLSNPEKIKNIDVELKRIYMPVGMASIIVETLSTLGEFIEKKDISYQDLYTELMYVLSSNKIVLYKTANIPNLRLLYSSIFDSGLDLITLVANKCELNLWYAQDGNQCPLDACRSRFKKMLGEKTLGIFNENGEAISYYGLSHPESNVSKLLHGMLGVNYSPQFYNNIPYVYTAGAIGDVKRLRIGAQVQQFLGVSSIPRVFKNFLQSIIHESQINQDVYYLYINLQKTLGGNKNKTPNPERYLEAKRTKALHYELRKIDKNKIKIVTLPSGNHIFFKGFDLHNGKALLHVDEKNNFELLKNFFNEVSDSVINNTNDFIIPMSVKLKIFNVNVDVAAAAGVKLKKLKGRMKQELLKILYVTAQEILGGSCVAEDLMISMEQRQAIYFHFVKHKFTNLLVTELNPKFFNISCKDAIDRAGVHNLWNILCNRIEQDRAMTLQEFEALLNIPAILVKDRPINDHVNALINVLGHYYYHLSNHKKQLIPWVELWLENNTVFKDNAESAFTWSYNKSMNDYNLAHGVYNDLYIAVYSGDLLEVDRILNNQVFSIYDNDVLKKDSILCCAAREGHFDMFLHLINFHEIFEKKAGYFNKNPLHGLRGWHADGKGTALNYLFQHLAVQDVEMDNLDKCIEEYLLSLFKNKSITSRLVSMVKPGYFDYYLNQIDEETMTPMMYLAKTGNCSMFEKIVQICNNNGFNINDIFDLKNTAIPNITLLQYAAQWQHEEFVKVLLDATKAKNLYNDSKYNIAVSNSRGLTISL